METERMRYLRLSIAEYEEVLPRSVTSILTAAKAVGSPTADILFKESSTHAPAQLWRRARPTLSPVAALRSRDRRSALPKPSRRGGEISSTVFASLARKTAYRPWLLMPGTSKPTRAERCSSKWPYAETQSAAPTP